MSILDTEEQSFLNKLAECPWDTLTHLVYADWLQERDRETEAIAHRIKWEGCEYVRSYRIIAFTNEAAMPACCKIKGLWVARTNDYLSINEPFIATKGFYLPNAIILKSFSGLLKKDIKYHTVIESVGAYTNYLIKVDKLEHEKRIDGINYVKTNTIVTPTIRNELKDEDKMG
jgi:uncharacterized protein (TIGR02996 family)